MPREGGVLATPRPVQSASASGGDLDLPIDSGQPIAPNTCEITKLDDRDFITASTMIAELVASSAASTASPSVIGMRSPVSAIINDGSAYGVIAIQRFHAATRGCAAACRGQTQ